MRLTSFRVRNFRNILDSGTVTVDGAVTCLVGKNEAGKSALLEALNHLRPAVPPAHELSIELDYPRWLKKRHEVDGTIGSEPVVEALFELDDNDTAALRAAFGGNVLMSASITVKRYYDKAPLVCSTSLDETGYVDSLAGHLSETDIGDRLDSPATLAELRAALTALSEKTTTHGEVTKRTKAAEAAAQALEDLNTRIGDQGLQKAATDAVSARLPRTFYFSRYARLHGIYDLATVLPYVDGSVGEDESIATAASFLRIARVDAAHIDDLNYEVLNSELEAVSNLLSDEVNEYWKQNDHLRLKVDTFNRPGAQQGQVDKELRFQVADSRHHFTNNLDRRSTGFRWFVSFVAAFFEFQQDSNLIVLLDEPGLSLHARAQRDLLVAIDERIGRKRQVLYSTHSPFMVRTEQIDRVRVVEDGGPDQGSVVVDRVLATDPDSLFPLQAALGYDIAQNLFIGEHNVLVEGVSDFTYLTALSAYLASEGRTSLAETARILPVGGAGNIPTFVSLMGTHLDTVVVMDGTSNRQRIHNQIDAGLLDRSQLLLIDTFAELAGADIEDMFTPGEYLSFYNATFGTSIAEADLTGDDRIIARIERAQGNDFNQHAFVGLTFLRGQNRYLAKLSDDTLDRFEALIAAINAALPS